MSVAPRSGQREAEQLLFCFRVTILFIKQCVNRCTPTEADRTEIPGTITPLVEVVHTSIRCTSRIAMFPRER